MDKLDTLHPIKIELLDPRDYVQSLVTQAQSCGLLTVMDISKLQNSLLMILAEQIDKWSKGDHTSIPIEKAQDIMTSMLCVIGMQLKMYQTPYEAIAILKIEPLNVLFEKGLKLVRRRMSYTRHMQKRIVENLLNTCNVFYRSTIVDGINGFFKLYQPEFAAHEIHITADYPTFMGRPNVDGIAFIEQYLCWMEAENTFCIRFASQDIHHLLCGLTQNYHRVPMNIFEPVLLSALGLIISNRSPKRLNLTKENVNDLHTYFSNMTIADIQMRMKNAFICLCKKIKLPQKSRQYVDGCLPKLAVILHNAVSMHTLDKVFLVPYFPEHEPKIKLSYGEQMEDRKYQNVVEKVLQADNGEEKIELILSEVHSVADLLDIVSDVELYAEDFDLLISRLPLRTFVSLLVQYPNDDFLDRESDQLLYESLAKRKQWFSPTEKRQVERILRAIQNEDSLE